MMIALKTALRATALASFLTVGGCTAPSGQPGDASSNGDRAGLGPRVDAYIARTMDWYGMPALSAAILSRGKVIYARSHGVVDVATGESVTNSHLYQLSSSSKLVSSVALMTLVEDGLVDLDAAVGEYLPQIPPAWRHVPLRQLLSHLSGLPDIVRCDDSAGEDAQAECTAALAEPGIAGEQFQYNQTNYYLVQKVLERISGQGLPDYVTERVFRPLGIREARYEGSSGARFPGLVSSYYPDDDGGIQPREYAFPSYLYSAAGLNASLDALVQWVQALQAGRIISTESLHSMWVPPILNDGRTSPYALGWDLREHAPGHRSAGHEGGGLTTIRIFPKDDIAVVLLTSGYASRFTPDEVAAELAFMAEPSLLGPSEAMLARMREALQTSDAAAALRAVSGTVEIDVVSPRQMERTFNRLAYELIRLRRFNDAVTLARGGLAELPESWILHDTLGEAYLATGDTAAAVTHYQRSIEINPENRSGQEILDSLGVG